MLDEPLPALLLLPRLRVQHANAVSSPLTWGFPAMTALLGLMTALERRLGPEAGLHFSAVGVICHHFEAQVQRNGYTHSLRLTRNPVLADGSSAAIVEEGRVHLELSLVFEVALRPDQIGAEARGRLAEQALNAVQALRVAGGSVLPLRGRQAMRHRPQLELMTDAGAEAEHVQQLMRRCLPGFALVLRDDLLQARLAQLRETTPTASALDAWLSLSRLTQRAPHGPEEREAKRPWQADTRPGWLVPLPVGFAPLSALHPPGSVRGARDEVTPFRFVETLWSVGQWISPHRLQHWRELLWYPDPDANGTYRCVNLYTQPHQN